VRDTLPNPDAATSDEAPAGAAAAVRLLGVRQVFPGGVEALRGIDLDVPAGQFLAVLGPSGCGKSTLLRLIAGLDRPTSGEVRVERADGAPRGRFDVAYVFQDAHLLPWRTVLGNVMLPLELQGVDGRTRAAAAREALERVGLQEAVTRYPAQLSGGMRMRASLARALVTNPTLLLLDEPFAALDEITRQRLDEQLRELWRSRGMTVIFVTHSTTEAVYLAERAVVLTRRPGRVIEDRTVALTEGRPASLRATSEFARETRFVYEALERGEA
jgi:NitT/TauT family transport system ATP-binding protein